MRNIAIAPCLNGFIVTVGCQTLAYTSIDELVVDLKHYLMDPVETEKRIIETKGINRKHVLKEDAIIRNQEPTTGCIGESPCEARPRRQLY